MWSSGVTATLASQQNREKKLKMETRERRSWQPRAATRGARREDSRPGSSEYQRATFQALKSGCESQGQIPRSGSTVLLPASREPLCVTPAPCWPQGPASVTPRAGPLLTPGPCPNVQVCLWLYPLLATGGPPLPFPEFSQRNLKFSGELTSVSLPRAGLGVSSP